MKSKKINKIIITVSCVIGIVIIGIVLYMVINNNSYKSLDLKYESTSKYTITSGSTGNVYDISKEECNNIIEKLNDTKVKQKNFEPTQAGQVILHLVMRMAYLISWRFVKTEYNMTMSGMR